MFGSQTNLWMNYLSLLKNKDCADSLYSDELKEHYFIDVDGYSFKIYRVGADGSDNKVVICGYLEKYGLGSKVYLTNKFERLGLGWYVAPILLFVIMSLGTPKDILVTGVIFLF